MTAMSGIRPSTERIKLPGAGQLLVIAAAVVAAWLLWSESRDRGWIPGVVPRSANEFERQADAFDSLQPPDVSELIATLSKSRNPAARRQALMQLASIGPKAAEARDAIRDRL